MISLKSGHHVFATVVDHVLGAERPDRTRLFLRTGDPDHRHAGDQRQLDGGAADAAGRSLDQDPLLRHSARCGVNEVVGDLVVGEASRIFERTTRRQRVCCAGRHGDVFGIASGAHRQVAGADEDGLAERRLSDTRASFNDGSGELDPGDRRKRRHPGVDTLAHQHFRHADPDRVGLDQNLAIARPRRRHLDIFKHRRGSGSSQQNGLHPQTTLVFPRRPGSIRRYDGIAGRSDTGKIGPSGDAACG